MKSTKLLFLSLIIMVLLLTFAGCFGGETDHIHAFGQWENKILPTCTTDGLESRVCPCGEVEKRVISATGHVEQILPERAATCSVGGLTEGKQCINCGEILLIQEQIPKISHIYEKFSCAECGATLSAGLYDDNYNLVATWDDLENSYGLNTNGGVLSNVSALLGRDNLKGGSIFVMDESITSIADRAFAYSSLSLVLLPDGLESVGRESFFGSSITEIIIPRKVNGIGNSAFSCCANLNKIEVAEENDYYKSVDGSLYTADLKTLIQYPCGKCESEFFIPDGVETVLVNSLSYNRALEKIYFPKTVTNIEQHAYYSCDSLSDVYLDLTTEEWEKIDNTYSWLSYNVALHYDEKTQFYITSFLPMGGSSVDRKKVVFGGNSLCIDDVLYTSDETIRNVEFANKDIIVSQHQYSDKLELLEQLLTADEYRVFRGTGDYSDYAILICHLEGRYYFINVISDTMHVYNILYTMVGGK